MTFPPRLSFIQPRFYSPRSPLSPQAFSVLPFLMSSFSQFLALHVTVTVPMVVLLRSVALALSSKVFRSPFTPPALLSSSPRHCLLSIIIIVRCMTSTCSLNDVAPLSVSRQSSPSAQTVQPSSSSLVLPSSVSSPSQLVILSISSSSSTSL